MEKYIKTKEDVQEIETKLNDYDNLLTLVEIIKNVFNHLTEKIDAYNKPLSENNKQGSDTTQQENKNEPNDEYDQLEKIV